MILPAAVLPSRRIKWSYATRIVPNLPGNSSELAGRLVLAQQPHRMGDIVVAEVIEIGQQRRLELHDSRRSTLFVDDLIGGVIASNDTQRTNADRLTTGGEAFQLLSPAGLCGGSIDSHLRNGAPTLLKSHGQLMDCNLKGFGLRGQNVGVSAPRSITVVGSGSSSGVTTATCALVNGLARAGHRVCVGIPCGSASARDRGLTLDAGAIHALDFTDAGYPSTDWCTRAELAGIIDALFACLCESRPDFVVHNVSNGLGQRESGLVLEHLVARGLLDATVYASHDTLGVREGLARLRRLGARVAAVSGRVTCSPLALREAQEESDVPVLRPEELSEPVFLARLAPDLKMPLEARPNHGSWLARVCDETEERPA